MQNVEIEGEKRGNYRRSEWQIKKSSDPKWNKLKKTAAEVYCVMHKQLKLYTGFIPCYA